MLLLLKQRDPGFYFIVDFVACMDVRERDCVVKCVRGFCCCDCGVVSANVDGEGFSIIAY